MEDDFKFISENGVNAVRIPVGWWIASDPTPPPPFVGGSLSALDNAFVWATYASLYLLALIIHYHPVNYFIYLYVYYIYTVRTVFTTPTSNKFRSFTLSFLHVSFG